MSDQLPDHSRWTLVHQVRDQAAARGERVWITFGDGAPDLTYAGFDRRSDAVAAALAARGIGEGDRVMLLVKNRAEFLIAMIGTMKCGAVVVPINTELRGAFLQHQLQNSAPGLVIGEAGLLDAFNGVDPGSAQPGHLVVVAGDAPSAPPPALASARVETWAAFEASGTAASPPDFTPTKDTIAGIMYTSGTTGPAKGVLLPHGHCYLFGAGSNGATGLAADDVYYVSMPVFHVNGLFIQVMAAHLAGARVHLVERFSPNRWLDEVIACGATITNLLGVMPEFVFNTAPGPRDRDHGLRLIMAVPISKEWGQAFEDRFGVRFLQGFGMTECGMPVWGDRHDREPVIGGCAGYPQTEHFEVRIGDPETDDPLPAGEVGELLIRPNIPGCFSAGYYNMPERTVEAWRNLWFHTGDACRMDERGRVHYIDRIKDCIRRRGENISAFEVEQVLNGHPLVAESAVVGVRVEGAGGEEEVKAVIVPAAGQPRVDCVALLDYCAERMPRYAVPRFVAFIAALDKTASGKLRKGDLRDAGVTAETWDRESVGYTLARR
ncbi:MAG: AMP-binding protein [Alphaproteobacteria bacterium]|nr:AMP-binding protein [Alphaproteobacteria bacterium]MCB9931222.1 AMP-binding protein [Alphaproteobacteria bacterium]